MHPTPTHPLKNKNNNKDNKNSTSTKTKHGKRSSIEPKQSPVFLSFLLMECCFKENEKNVSIWWPIVVTVKKRYNNKIPWLTESLKVFIKTKNKLCVKAKCHDTAYNKLQYANHKTGLHKLVHAQKKKYYNDLICLYKMICKNKTWEKVINRTKTKSGFSQFLVDGVLSDDNKVITEKMNHHFTNVGSDLARKF